MKRLVMWYQKWNTKPLASINTKQILETTNNLVEPARLMINSFTIMFVDMAKRIETEATDINISPVFNNSETENVTTLRLANPPSADDT